MNEKTDYAIDNGKQLNRRKFLSGAAIAGIGTALIGVATTVTAQGTGKMPNQPEADNGHDYPMPPPKARTEADFRNGVIGPATLSLIVSEIALDRSSHPMVKEFANFELREAIGVTTVLKKLGTAVPPMDANATVTLNKIKSAAKGNAFDREYIKAQLANHEFLRDLAEVYLKNSAGATSVPEMHGQHLAMLALATFKEHVVHTKNILKVLG